MTVLIDQDHVQDFLIELENSPMSIQVKDFELQRPDPSRQARERTVTRDEWAAWDDGRRYGMMAAYGPWSGWWDGR